MIGESGVDGSKREGSERGIALRVIDAEPRQLVFLTGLVTETRRSQSHGPCFEADLEDGTGRVTLVFFGRDDVEGIEPGACLTVSARALMARGRIELLNPSYEFVPAPRDP